jgi:dienelactone hydrolase
MSFRSLSRVVQALMVAAALPARAAAAASPAPTAAAERAPLAVTEQPLPYRVGELAFEGRLLAPADGAVTATVLLAPDWRGVNADAVGEARDLAARGWAVLVVDYYGRGVRPADDAESQRLAGPMIENRALVRSRMQAAGQALQARYAGRRLPLAAMGHSFGGLAALELARSGAPLAAVAVLWGELRTPDAASAARIEAPVLVLHGSADPIAPLASVADFAAAMDRHGRRHEVVLYGGARHAFTNPEAGSGTGPLAYAPEAAAAARARLLAFFTQHLQQRPAAQAAAAR